VGDNIIRLTVLVILTVSRVMLTYVRTVELMCVYNLISFYLSAQVSNVQHIHDWISKPMIVLVLIYFLP
jgi:hypothetical protein